MRDPLMRLVEWAVRRTDWHKQMMSEIEAVRIDNEISRILMEAQLAQAKTRAKVEIVDDLRAAMEANRG